MIAKRPSLNERVLILECGGSDAAFKAGSCRLGLGYLPASGLNAGRLRPIKLNQGQSRLIKPVFEKNLYIPAPSTISRSNSEKSSW